MKPVQTLLRLPILRRLAPSPVVPVVRLVGPIGASGTLRGGMTLSGVADPLERAFALANAKAVALVINSPGGSPVQSALIAQRIRDLADEKKVKVYAFCEDAAASGGYWLACAADEIYAAESSIIGSIGVVSASFGFPELLRKYGVERRVYSSGERKVILDPFDEEKEEDVARLKALQEQVHENFKTMVRSRRGNRLKADESSLFNGDFWVGQSAYELGLIDGVGELRRTMRGVYGEKVKLVPVATKRSWLRRNMPLGASLAGAALSGGEARASLSQGWADDLLSAVEERALWGRLGL